MKQIKIDKFKIKHYKQRFWQVAEVYLNGNKIACINKFYKVTTKWIIIYSTIGGQGTGYRKGEIINKIFIGNAEFSKQTI